MNDLEHLAAAGIQDTGGDAQPSAPESNTQTPAEGAPQTQAEQQEMFELMGNKFPVNTEFQFNHGGQVLKVPYSTVKNKFLQAQHLEDQRLEFKTERQKHAEQLQNLEKYKGFHDKYSGLQAWSEQNPQDWARLYEIYQNKDKHLLSAQLQGQNAQDPNQPGLNMNPLIEEITTLKKQVAEYGQIAEQYKTQQQQAQEQKDVEIVKGQIGEFKTEFPEINLEEKDPDGVALWAKIITWGMQNGYRDFAPAAHMFLKPRIIDTVSSRARSEAIKGVKQDHAQGVVKRSTVPIGSTPNGQAGKFQPIDPRKHSYSEIANFAKEGAFSS